MTNRKPFHPWRWLPLLVLAVAPTTMAATAVTLTFSPGGHLDLPISNVNPNLIVVPGDRVTNISSAAGLLTDKKNTQAGAALFSTASDKPFTLYVETRLGQVFSINATPRATEGRSYRLFPTTPTPRPVAKVWETAQPYESMLVALNRALLRGALPEGYGPASIDKEAPFTRAGLQATPDSAWDGNALHIVRYRLTNPLSVPVVLREPDFWTPGTRAIMVHPRYQRLIAGASTWLYVIRTQEPTDGQH